MDDMDQLIRNIEASNKHDPATSERLLIGSMLLSPECVADVMEIVRSPEDFNRDDHRQIYASICRLHDLHGPSFDPGLVCAHLVAEGWESGSPYTPDAPRTSHYVVWCCEEAVSGAFWNHHARVVAASATVRRLQLAADTIIHESMRVNAVDTEDVAKLVSDAEQTILGVADTAPQRKPRTTAQAIQDVYERLVAAESSSLNGVSAGFWEIDRLTRGFKPGEMVVLAARPSIGKTQLALQIARFAAKSGTPVGFFSLEMSSESILERLMAYESGVEPGILKMGGLGEEEKEALKEAVGRMKTLPIELLDPSFISTHQIRSKARRMVTCSGVGLVLIDYLQLVTGPRVYKESRQVEVAAVSRALKSLAMELKIPVLVLAQLNRESERRDGNRPRISDLRESGATEQDADIVMLLHREEHHHIGDAEWLSQNPDKIGKAEVIIAKNRNGATGSADLRWSAAGACFESDLGQGYSPKLPRRRDPYADREEPAPF